MGWFLYRHGRFAFRRRWLVVGLLLVVLAAALVGAATLSGPTSDGLCTPSQQAIDLLQQRFPQASADGATARVVFATSDGKLTDKATRAAVEDVVAQLKRRPASPPSTTRTNRTRSTRPRRSASPKCPTRCPPGT